MIKYINKAIYLPVFVLTGLLLIFQGCANQQPPGGGEEDKTPPKLVSQSPSKNTLNFSGNSIILEFDEYVDRRSLQEAFHISPPVKGDISYNWSGKEVEISFEKPLWKIDPNKTFVITVNSNLTDIRGNAITSPISFAFSTGNKIDKAAISGKVFNKADKPVSILAYKLELNDSAYDPTKNVADYISETSEDGTYDLTNLSPGKYRIIAIEDEDRNLLYTSERESYAVLPEDISLEDSAVVTGLNFFMKKISKATELNTDVNLTDFFPDSLGIVSTSIEKDSRSVLPDQSIFFFFNKHKPSREDFVKSFILKDEAGNSVRVVFNWRNDSLVEIFPPDKFGYAKDYSSSFKIVTGKDSVYNYELKFRTVSSNSFGEIKGSIKTADDIKSLPVVIKLSSLDIKPQVKYTFEASDTSFDYKNVFEADYTLFSFLDKNKNSEFDYGSPFPFQYSEPFYVYPQKISVKGGWAIENVIIRFSE